MPDFPNEIEVSENSIDPETGKSDEVSIIVDGSIYRFWETVDINFSFDDFADTFTISGPFDFENRKFLDLFRPYKYKEIGLYVAGELKLTGTLLSPSPSNTPDSSTISISGYSAPGIIADCNAAPVDWPIAINGLNLEEIANKLTNPFGIKVLFESDPGPKFSKSDKVRMDVDEKIGNFLITLAKQRGLIINSNMSGELVFSKVTSENATLSIVSGQWPWIGSNCSFDGQNMFSAITAIGTNNKRGYGSRVTVENPALASVEPARHKIYHAADVLSGGLQTSAKAELGRMIADSLKINLSVVGWHRPDGLIWSDNQKIIFHSPRDLLISEHDYVIRNAKLTKGPDKATTDLELVLPESYSGEIPKSFPWED